MTTTPFENRPDDMPARGSGEADVAGHSAGDGPDVAAPLLDQAGGGVPEELLPENRPFQAPDTTTD